MADTAVQTGKRQRLVDGAQRVFYERGVERTSLADIAATTGIPVGNIYYYFKTKDELIEAVVEHHARQRDELLARVGRRRTPQARLKAFLHELDLSREAVASHGCPVGTLSSELDKRCGEQPSTGSQHLLGPLVDWAQEQFEQMGQPDPRGSAISLVASYEGAAVLAHSLRDPKVMHQQSERLRRWIDDLPTATPRPAAT